MTGPQNPFFGKRHSQASLDKIAQTKRLPFDEIISRVSSKNATLLSPYSDYSSQNSLLSVRCDQCLTPDNISLFNINRCWRCRVCYPIGSTQQVEIFNFVKSLGFDDARSSARDVVAPLELDVWVPSKKLAIEYHGLYWHSGGKNGTFDKATHRNKFKRCNEAGIKLIQLFGDEWENKQDICRSIIKNALSANENKLNARDCEVKEIDQLTSRQFLEQSHISGATRATVHYGLTHPQHGLVGVTTIRQTRQARKDGAKKWGDVYEVARMAFSPGTSVRGGASKMMSVIKQRVIDDKRAGLLSYADLRFGAGRVYESCGFSYKGTTRCNYWYTDGHQRFDRNMFMADKMNNLSENEVAFREGVRAVWGCGNAIYLWTAPQ